LIELHPDVVASVVETAIVDLPPQTAPMAKDFDIGALQSSGFSIGRML
jgi:hypothetical protein